MSSSASFADLQEDRRLVAPRVGAHDQLQDAPRAVAKVRAQRTLVVPREALHDLLEIETQIVARLVDGQMLGLGH